MSGIILRRVFIAMMVLPSLVFASKTPADVKKAKILNKTYRMRVPFIENRGQVESDNVSFYAKTFGGTLFIERNGTLIYNLPLKDEGGVIIKEILTDKKLKIEGLEPSHAKINYFKGNDQSKWRTDIPSYGSITMGEVYEGIELTLRAYGNNVEKLFTVLPGENPETIKIKLQGAKGLEVNEEGELEVITELGPVKFTKPIAYQEIDDKRIEIAADYSIQSLIKLNPKSYSYGFKVGEYNNNYPLVIDPLLASTFIGGGDTEQGWSIALDGSGNVYVTGYTGAGYPTIGNPYDSDYNGGMYDVFISKLNSNLTSLLASTFIGGSNIDVGLSLVLDGSANVYVTGQAQSGYPTIGNPHDSIHNGNFDVFVSKLNSNLSSLLASTLIGGTGDDIGHSIALAGENVYIAGYSGTTAGYPTTAGAHDQSYNGGINDVFVSKLNSNLSSLLASTFIGGTRDDRSHSIALAGENVYIAGYSTTGDYPTTSGAYDESYNGGNDVFVSKLNSNLSSLSASTFIGGVNNEAGKSIALDGGGSVYVTGMAGAGYPTEGVPYDDSHNGSYDVFVSKLNSNLSSLSASTFIGGGSDDYGFSIALDGSGNVYVTGYAQAGYPITSGAYDESHNGGLDGFVSKLDSTLSSLSASTFIGGGNSENVYSIALDGSGNVYVTGYAQAGYPITSGAYDESHNGGWDVFVSKLDSKLSTNTTTSSTTTTTAPPSPTTAPPSPTTAPQASTTTVDPNATTTTTVKSTTTIFSPGTTTINPGTTTVSPGTTTSPVLTTTTTTKKCLAKKIYGDDSKEAELMRQIRDNVLSRTLEGREIIKLYYEWSPAVVKMMEDDEEFNEYLEEVFNEVLQLIKVEIIKQHSELSSVKVKGMEEDEFKEYAEEVFDEVLQSIREE